VKNLEQSISNNQAKDYFIRVSLQYNVLRWLFSAK